MADYISSVPVMHQIKADQTIYILRFGFIGAIPYGYCLIKTL